MAYAAVVSLAQTIDLTLNHPKYSITPQEKDQIKRVKEYAILLQEFLQEFPEKAKPYEGRIKKLTQGAEDILEFSLSEHIQQSHDSFLGSLGAFLVLISNTILFWLFPKDQAFDSFAVFSKIKNLHRLYIDSYYQLSKLVNEMELISEKVMDIKISITNKDERVDDSTHVPSTSGPVHKEAMVGLGNNLMEVKLRLCRDSSNLEIVPIVGMGGIGKTTLARNVYDDPLITDRFDIRAWVTVSQDYHIQDIVAGLLVSMGDAENELIKQHNVYQKLKSRRYIIVIDDIWSIEAWDEIKLMFPDDGNGSRIMLTTRLTDLATYAGSCHEMRLMDEDESWNLLRKNVFKQDPCPTELECIGKTIARSCRGLPLAVVVISGLLAVDRTKAAWENIAKDVKSSAFSANERQIDKILSLSYTHLPHHLRPCFLYMGGFPEDHDMHVSLLIKLWVAEGFLKPHKSKSYEETAEEYLEGLVNRNLFLVTKRKSNGRIKYLGIHDLIREMCIRKAKEENFILLVKGVLQQDTTIPHRVSTIHSDLNFHENVDASTTRTIICLKHRLKDERCSLRYFKLLRVLAVSYSHEFFIKKDTNRSQVFELFHLRYLSFDSPCNIPASISNLQNLQTLVIGLKDRDSIWLHELPVEICRMPQLRHLLFYYGVLPFDETEEFTLENLQTISGAINFVCSRKIVKMIPNLKKLGLTYDSVKVCNQPECDRWICRKSYELENLKYLQQLEILKIVGDGVLCHVQELNPEYPRTLKKLTLDYVRLPWKDMNAVASLPCLEVLKLRRYACDGDTWETSEGGFPELRFLLIDGLHLQHWITESNHFPRLKCLVIHNCWHLCEIPECIGEISTLELIEVDDRVKSLVRSAKQIRRDQLSCGNDALQVHVRIFKFKFVFRRIRSRTEHNT